MDDSPRTTVQQGLQDMGIVLAEPSSRKELVLTEALEAFASFCFACPQECLSVLERHAGRSVGELQGGSEDYEIYRIAFENGGALAELLAMFYAGNWYEGYENILTVDKVEQYIRSMVSKHNNIQCDTLDNLLLIVSFGPVDGQVRHIDQTWPNLPIFLYLSKGCPSTIVYDPVRLEPQEEEDANHETTGINTSDIETTSQLIDYWEEITKGEVPPLLKTVLVEHGDTLLSDKYHTEYYSNWETINEQLQVFGKLYQRIDHTWALPETKPGSLLIAGGESDHIHAGPPTTGPRMFFWALGYQTNE